MDPSVRDCKSAAVAKKRKQARVPATKTAPVIPLPDPRSMESALAAIGRGAAHYASDEDLFRAMARLYQAEVRYAARNGLTRDYQDREERLPTVRGRIDSTIPSATACRARSPLDQWVM